MYKSFPSKSLITLGNDQQFKNHIFNVLTDIDCNGEGGGGEENMFSLKCGTV